jgi:hypothetical protein
MPVTTGGGAIVADVVAGMDLSGGLADPVDEVTAEPPAGADFREGLSMWIWDDAGGIALPRLAVEAVGATWETVRGATLNLTQPGGRILLGNHNDRPHAPLDGAGRPRVFGAGPLRFVCEEPFRRWHLSYEGRMVDSTADDLIAGRTPLPQFGAQVVLDGEVPPAPGGDAAPDGTVGVTIDVAADMATPPWVQGSLGGTGFVPGEHRFEQLFTATGTVRIGDDETRFRGGGLRIHRTGGNRTDPSDFFGHCWHSALFPDGRAFGFIYYHPRPDGSEKFREGWVIQAGRRYPAEIIGPPWVPSMQAAGQDCSFTLRTEAGDIRIEGETVMSVFFPMRTMRPGLSFPPLQQGIARYRWDGVEVYGMIERSAYMDGEGSGNRPR